MDLGRVLSTEEVEAIKHTITPYEKIRTKRVVSKESYIEAPYCGKRVRRNETVDK
jgi:hypothetical protein